MILADTSVWADHFRDPETALTERYAAGLLVTHAMVIGEIALGYLSRRAATLAAVRALRRLEQIPELELLALIEERELVGRGVGLVDVHLLASVCRTPGAQLWTRDKRLRRVAGDFDVLAEID